jgi:hypothetical protein
MIQLASGGVLKAAERAMLAGPGLQLGDRQTMSAELERNIAEEWEPYGLGHSYVRALQQRLAIYDSSMAGSEAFLWLMVRVLRSSGRRLFGADRNWESPVALGDIYGWLNWIEGAPPARVREFLRLPESIDLLHFLRTGEREEGASGDFGRIGDVLEQIAPEAWKTLRSIHEAHYSSDELRRIDSQLDHETASARMMRAVLCSTLMLNMSENGRGELLGRIAAVEDGGDAYALRIGKAIWWLLIPTPEATSISFLKDVPTIGRDTFVSRDMLDGLTGRECWLDSFVMNSVDVEVVDMRGMEFLPKLIFLIRSARNGRAELAMRLAPGRVLRPTGVRVASLLHRVPWIKNHMSGAMTADLGAIARSFKDAALAQQVRDEATDYHRSLARQREIWKRKICAALLEKEGGPILEHYLRRRMRDILAEADAPLLASAYAGWHALDGAKEDEVPRIEAINRLAALKLRCIAFEFSPDGASVRYRGCLQ